MASSAQALEVKKLELSTGKHAEILSIHFSQKTKARIFALENPDRLVIDLPPFKWKVDANSVLKSGSRTIERIRYARFDVNTSRIVIDLHMPVSFSESRSGATLKLTLRGQNKAKTDKAKQSSSVPEFWSRRGKSRPPIVIAGTKNDQTAPKAEAKKATKMPVAKPKKTALPTSKPRKKSSGKKPLIVIDAGHGGKDPGAIGHGKTKEKYVTLRYARALKKALKKTGNYRIELTRNKDKIIPLRDRFRIARRKKADLFISLHADAAPNKRAHGFSVYTLSEKASDSEAAALAKQENKVDLLAEVDLTHEDEEVADILIDLARRETKNKSSQLAEEIVKVMKRKVKLLQNPHRHAGFAVLKAPDIPSVLVEIGFLTNRKEEKLLNQKEHQNKVVNGLTHAIDQYFEAH